MNDAQPGAALWITLWVALPGTVDLRAATQCLDLALAVVVVASKKTAAPQQHRMEFL